MSPSDNRTGWYAGQGLWQHVPESDWKDWVWQLKNRLTNIEQIEQYMTLTPDERAGCLFAKDKLALAITPYFFNLIDRSDPNCPIRLQVIPRGGESVLSEEEQLDSLGEDAHSPVPGLVHRYPDRVLFLVTDRCAAYCRYCTRSRLSRCSIFLSESRRGSPPESRTSRISGWDSMYRRPCSYSGWKL